MAVSPEVPGNFSTKNRRRQKPAASAKTGFEKIRFIGGTHLTIEQTESRGRTLPSTESVSLPSRQVAKIHEGTPSHLLRRGARALAPHSPRLRTHRSTAHPAAGVLLRDHRRQRRVARRAAARYKTRLPCVQTEKEAPSRARR